MLVLGFGFVLGVWVLEVAREVAKEREAVVRSRKRRRREKERLFIVGFT
jgi:hypothetical protein